MEENQIPPLPSTIVPIEKPKSKFPLFIIIGIVLFLLIAGSAAGFYFYKKQTPKQIACTLEAKVCPDGTSVGRQGPTCEFAPCPTAAADSMSDWKSYTDTTLGFEFKYPTEYTITKNVDGPYPGTTEILNHNITWNKQSSIDTCKGDGCRYSTNSTSIQLGQNSFTKVVGVVGAVGGSIPENYIDYEIPIPNSTDKIIFRIKELPSDQSYQDLLKKYPDTRTPQNISTKEVKILEQILSTLKLTDSQTIDTSSWKTYVGQGITFSYPQDWKLIEDLPYLKLYPLTDKTENADSPMIRLWVSEKTFDTYPQDNINQNGIEYVTNWKKVSFNGISGISYQEHQCPQCNAVTTVFPFPKSAKTVEIGLSTDAQRRNYETIYTQILSTFKFTK